MARTIRRRAAPTPGAGGLREVGGLLRGVVRRLGGRGTDPLTGLPGRAVLHDRGPLALARGAGRPVALLLLDLDGFKRINDLLGHHEGDAVLVEVARRLERLAGPQDLLVRRPRPPAGRGAARRRARRRARRALSAAAGRRDR